MPAVTLACPAREPAPLPLSKATRTKVVSGDLLACGMSVLHQCLGKRPNGSTFSRKPREPILAVVPSP